MGLDYGLRRVGIALSDPTWSLATPLTTIRRRRGKRPPVSAVAELATQHQVSYLVVGLPLTLEGEESEWTREVRTFGNGLGERLGCSVAFVDERFSSVTAENRLREGSVKSVTREDKDRVDAAAAAVILQDWLDAQKRTDTTP